MKEDTVIKLKRQEEEKGFDILTDILRRGAKKLLAQAVIPPFMDAVLSRGI